MTQVRFRRSGAVKGVADANRQIRQFVATEIGQATIRRASRRLRGHPSGAAASSAMSVESGRSRATVLSPLGNPGVIPAFRDGRGYSRWGKRAMWWPGARRPVKWVRRYKGLRPLLEAEMSRVTNSDVGSINFDVK